MVHSSYVALMQDQTLDQLQLDIDRINKEIEECKKQKVAKRLSYLENCKNVILDIMEEKNAT